MRTFGMHMTCAYVKKRTTCWLTRPRATYFWIYLHFHRPRRTLIPHPRQQPTMPPKGPRSAESLLSGPLARDQGTMINVKHDHVATRFRHGGRTECQQCGAPVDRTEPHTTAFIRLETALGLHHKRPAFCGSECWQAFATVD